MSHDRRCHPVDGPSLPNGDIVLSTKGNRSNPNRTRLSGKPDEASRDPNRSDVAKTIQADSKSPGGRAFLSGGGSHKETREHNKHDHQGQSGHKPQKHGPDEEKR